MKWFGEPWPKDWKTNGRAPVCSNDDDEIPVPVGEQCLFCGEEIEATDQGVKLPSYLVGTKVTFEPAHVSCMVRVVVGNDMQLP